MSDLSASLADDASQASRSSLAGSLLDRIRAQRERDAGTANLVPEPLSVPNYAPVASSEGATAPPAGSWFGFLGGGGGGQNNTSNFNYSALSEGLDIPTTALLSEEEGGEYSMVDYARTFVHDVYNGFRSLHPVAQGVGLFLTVVIMFKLFLM